MSEFIVFPDVGDRGYRRKGRTITIHETKIDKSVMMENAVTDVVLATFKLPTKDMAKKVMDDLYYGEYTGA